MMKSLLTLLLSTAVLSQAPLFAHEITQGSIKMAHPWTKATRPSQTEASGYFVKMVNQGTEDDTLISASSSIAKVIELHEMRAENNLRKMTAVPGIKIPAGQTVPMAPGEYHIMFIGLTKPLVKGDLFSAELVFEKAGKVTVDFQVEDPSFSGKAKDVKMPPGYQSGQPATHSHTEPPAKEADHSGHNTGHHH